MAYFPFWYFLFKTYISLYYLSTCTKKSSSPHIASYLRVSSRVKLSSSSLSSAQSRELLWTLPHPSKLSSTIVPIIPHRFPHPIDIAYCSQVSPSHSYHQCVSMNFFEMLRKDFGPLCTTLHYFAWLCTYPQPSTTLRLIAGWQWWHLDHLAPFLWLVLPGWWTFWYVFPSISRSFIHNSITVASFEVINACYRSSQYISYSVSTNARWLTKSIHPEPLLAV
jgi:hypothetical protein